VTSCGNILPFLQNFIGLLLTRLYSGIFRLLAVLSDVLRQHFAVLAELHRVTFDVAVSMDISVVNMTAFVECDDSTGVDRSL
jgi:hypothetical protein